LVTRAKIILQAAAGARKQHIADELGLHWQTVSQWWSRWLGAAEQLAVAEAESEEKELSSLVQAALADQPRPGAPATFTAEQLCQIMVVACEAPAESERPVTHWTPTELADEVVKRGIVARISPRTVGRFLKGVGFETPPFALLAEQQAGGEPRTV